VNNSEDAAPLRRQTEEDLRKAILAGRYNAGERLKERELMETLGVSRTLLREALRQIESEGLVTLVPNRGAIVAVLEYEQAEQIYEVRSILEAQACVDFALRATHAHLRELQDTFAKLKLCGDKGDIEGTLSFSTTFYDVILNGGGNKVLSSMLKLLHNRIVLLRRTSISEPDRLPETIAELTDIFNALCARDEVAAGKASVHHVRQAARTALRALRRNTGSP